MPRMRILLIDDDALLTRSYVRMLAGAEVVVCRAAAEARAALEHALEFDIVLCDVDLGGASGVDLCDALEADVASRVVFISGGLKSARDERRIEELCARVLFKPFTRDDVEQEIERIHRSAA